MTIYERMACSPLKCANQLSEGVAPQRTFIVQFVYENGLVVNYNGTDNGWKVVRPEDKKP